MSKNKITDLKFDNKNFNKGTEYGKKLMEKSLSKFGAGRSILIDKNNRIIAGNKTTENFGELGLEDVKIVETDGRTLVAVKRNDIDLDTPEGREFALADNQTAKSNIDFDFDILEDELGEQTLQEWGLEPIEESENIYTQKIEAPKYEPTGEKPNIEDLLDDEKTKDFIEKINKSKATKQEKEFLKKAAYRHLTFNYKNIAEFYIHSNKEVQELMEQSALVIIDFEKAIENGYIQLSEKITNQYLEEYGE